jgi:hypothetical protein
MTEQLYNHGAALWVVDVLDKDDPLSELVGLGAEIWASLGGGDAVIAWLRSDEGIPPPWEKMEATSAPGASKAPALMPDHLL